MTSVPEDAFFVRSLANYSADVLLVTNAAPIDAPRGPEIVFCNPAFERMTGWTRAEAMGLTPRILQSELTDRAELDKIREALTTWTGKDVRESTRATLLNRTKAGTDFWVELELIPFWDDDYVNAYWCAVQRDITNRKARETQLIRALEAAEVARQQQQDFIARVSHEMRTPLNAIIGFADALSANIAGDLTERQREYIGYIKSGGGQLTAIIQDVLDVSSLDRNLLRVSNENISIKSIIDYSTAILKSMADSKNICIDEDKYADQQILADPIRSRQFITNILENAIKYSSVGGNIYLSTHETADFVALNVTDEGRGMTEQQIGVALSLFGRLDDPRTSGPDGLGLGLPITVQLMKRQGGDVHIMSTPGEGSTFSLLFQKYTGLMAV